MAAAGNELIAKALYEDMSPDAVLDLLSSLDAQLGKAIATVVVKSMVNRYSCLRFNQSMQ